MSKYINFWRGTQEKYNAITQKNTDTLYFINSGDKTIYLGQTPISNYIQNAITSLGGTINGTLTFNNDANIVLNDDIASYITYKINNAEKGKIYYNALDNSFVFNNLNSGSLLQIKNDKSLAYKIGSNEYTLIGTDGTIVPSVNKIFNSVDKGLVPAPGAANVNKFLKGNGTWDTLSVENGVTKTGTFVAGQVLKVNNATGIIESSGYTIAKSVPSNADFNNTWRPVADNLTSSSTTESLSANQGRLLKSTVDGKLGKAEKAADSDKLGGLDMYRYFRTGGGFGGDLNTFPSNASAIYTPNDANAPSSYGVVLNISDTQTWRNQLAFGTGGEMYFRQKINDESWRNWGQIWHSINFDPASKLDANGTAQNAEKVGNFAASSLIRNMGYGGDKNADTFGSYTYYWDTYNSTNVGFGPGTNAKGILTFPTHGAAGTAFQLGYNSEDGTFYNRNKKGTWGSWGRIMDERNTYLKRNIVEKSQSVSNWYLLGATVDNHYNGFVASVTGSGVASAGVACTYRVSAHSTGHYNVLAYGNQGASKLKFGYTQSGRIIQIWVKSDSSEFASTTVTLENSFGGAVVWTQLNGSDPRPASGGGITEITPMQIWDGYNSNRLDRDWNCNNLISNNDVKAKQGHFENNINGVNLGLILRNNITSNAAGSEYTIGSDIQFRHYQDAVGASIKYRGNAYFGTRNLAIQCSGINLEGNTHVVADKLLIGSHGYGTSDSPKLFSLAFKGHYGGDYARITSVEQSGTSGHGTLKFFVRGNRGGATSEPDLVLSLDQNKNAWFENGVYSKGPIKINNVDVCLTNDGRLTNARPASDVHAWAKAASKPSYSASEVGARPNNWVPNWTEVAGKPELPGGQTTVPTTTDIPIQTYGCLFSVPGGGTMQLFQPHLQGGTPRLFFRSGFDGLQRWSNWGEVCLTTDGRLTNARPASDVYAWAKAASKPSYSAGEVGALSTSGGTISGNLVVSGNISQTSSIKFKENINEFKKDALNILKNTKVVTYNYINDKNSIDHVGFIAENTPVELSTKDKNTMDIGSCIGVLIKSVQELMERIDNIEKML